MRILLIGCDPGLGTTLVMAIITQQANRMPLFQPTLVEQVQIITAPEPEAWKVEDYCDFRIDYRDRQTEREQARYHDARFPKWTHQKRRTHRSRRR